MIAPSFRRCYNDSMLSLREYQQTMVSKVLTGFETNRRIMSVLPTGGGKTVVASEIAMHFPKILWAAHRHELLVQAGKKLTEAGHPNFTLQSVFSEPPAGEFDLMVLDETHHEPAPTMQGFQDRLKVKRVLGLTATPFRLDNHFIDFDLTVEGATFEELIAAGFLVPIDVHSVKFAANRQGTLTEWLTDHPDKARGSIVFVPGIKAAKDMQQLLDPHFRTAVVTGEQSTSTRDEILKRFTDHNLDMLFSCMVLTEGTDLPRTQTVVLARKTESLSLLMQMVGRGVRPFPGKEVCNVVEAMTAKERKPSVATIISPRRHLVHIAAGTNWQSVPVAGARR